MIPVIAVVGAPEAVMAGEAVKSTLTVASVVQSENTAAVHAAFAVLNIADDNTASLDMAGIVKMKQH